MSQEDFELIEFPAKLLPKDSNNVTITVQSRGTQNRPDQSTEKLLEEIQQCYGVGERELERFKEEISNDSFLKISKLGATAATITWDRPFPEIFGNSIKIDATIMNIDCTCAREDNCYCEGYVDYVRKGLKLNFNSNSCRINLPIDLKVSLLAKTSVGYFKSNEIVLKAGKFNDLSGVFVVSDRDFELLREKGGHVSGTIDQSEPITAVVVESFESELFRSGIENNLPVVGVSWVESLLSTGELPPFEAYLLK